MWILLFLFEREYGHWTLYLAWIILNDTILFNLQASTVTFDSRPNAHPKLVIETLHSLLDAMDYKPRFSQPFTLNEAICLDVAVITEGNCPWNSVLNNYTLIDLFSRNFETA